MKHFKIIIGEKEFDVSANFIIPLDNGDVRFYNDINEPPIHIAKNFSFIQDVTEQVHLENLAQELTDAVNQYFHEADHRIFNDLPIFDKEEVRKEAVKISVLYDKIQEIQKRIKT